MPSLPQDKADRVAQAEDTGGAMPEGTYEFYLKDCKENPGKEGGKGPYWTWEFAIPEDAERFAKRRCWRNTSLDEASDWAMKQTYAGFGVPVGTDTDELIGERVLITLGIETASQGKMKNQKVNYIVAVLPKDTDAVVTPQGTSKSESEPLF